MTKYQFVKNTTIGVSTKSTTFELGFAAPRNLGKKHKAQSDPVRTNQKNPLIPHVTRRIPAPPSRSSRQLQTSPVRPFPACLGKAVAQTDSNTMGGGGEKQDGIGRIGWCSHISWKSTAVASRTWRNDGQTTSRAVAIKWLTSKECIADMLDKSILFSFGNFWQIWPLT